MRVVLVVHVQRPREPLIDGVTTNVETQPGEGGVGKLVVKGKDLSRADGHRRARSALPFPGDAAVGARAADPRAKYAAFGVIPMVIPRIVEDLPMPIEQIPQQRGTDYAYVKHLAQRVRLRLLPRARTRARHVDRLLGPGDPRRRAAAGADREHGCA